MASRSAELQRQVFAARDREMLLNKVSGRKSGRRGQISAAYSAFLSLRYIPSGDAEERLKLPGAIEAEHLENHGAHFVLAGLTLEKVDPLKLPVRQLRISALYNNAVIIRS